MEVSIMKYFMNNKEELFFEEKESKQFFNLKEDHERLNDAITFAVSCHSGQCRKGSNKPYIFHPLEVMNILNNMNADTNLLIAGVLHDVVEDSDATLDDIENRFGKEVAELVASHTEDKSFSWKERKQSCIDILKNGNKRECMLIMADVVANQRNILKDYQLVGEELWNRFNAPKEMQYWYYDNVQAALYNMQFDADTKDIYWEMVNTFKDIFVKYFADENNDKLYQITETSCYGLNRKEMYWKETVPPDPDVVEPIPRSYAEMLEDYWQKEYEDQCIQEMLFGRYKLFSCNDYSVEIWFENMRMHFYDADKIEYLLDYAGTGRLLYYLHQKHGFKTDIETILLKEFGCLRGIVNLLELCQNMELVLYQPLEQIP